MGNPAVITIGIDSSSSCCGIAVFENGDYKRSFAKHFAGGFTIQKFREMTAYFDELFSDINPDIVLMEEPIMMRNGKITTMLNQIGGMIFGLASTYARTIDMVHNRTIKKEMGFKTKEESLKLAKVLTGKDCETDDESDAILLVHSYKRMVDRL